jgi:hypothetical protein
MALLVKHQRPLLNYSKGPDVSLIKMKSCDYKRLKIKKNIFAILAI